MRERLYVGRRITTPDGQGTILEIVNANSRIVGSNTKIDDPARVRVMLTGRGPRWFNVTELTEV